MSADSLAELDREFSRYSDDTQEFVEDLDVFFVKSYTHTENLPLGAAAWLCRWDIPAEGFAKTAMNDADQLVQLLQQSFALRSHLLGDQFWFATAGVLCRWRFRSASMAFFANR